MNIYRDNKLYFLCIYYSEQIKASKVKTFGQLVSRFVKNGKFVRFTDKNFRRKDLCNFNTGVAELLFKEKIISEIENRKQKSLYGYRISGWNHKVFKEYNLTHLGEAFERCVTKDGSFKPIGGKEKFISTNYTIASILRQESLLSEKAFLLVKRPIWKYRKLTKEELLGTEKIFIDISKWPTDTRKVLTVLKQNKPFDMTWTECFLSFRLENKISLKFLAENFLRIPSWSDIPVFKATGHRINRVFGPMWTSKKPEELFEIVRKTLQKNNLLT